MKCLKCNAEWTVPQNVSLSLSNCPFCGAPLTAATPKVLSTTEDVLREITSRFGLEVLRNGQKLVAIFSDLSPQMKKERLLLSYLVQENGNHKLLEARGKDVYEQRARFQQVCRYMIDEQFVAEEAARRICLSFSVAIGLDVSDDHAADGADNDGRYSTAGPGPAPVKPVQPAKPAQPVKSVQPAKPAQPVKPVQPAKSAQPAIRQQSTNQIDTYAKYQKALEDYYLQLGKKPLTDSQIQQFISTHSLGSKYKISLFDVREDLKAVYKKHTPGAGIGSRNWRDSAPSKTITTYRAYMDELERMFLQNNRKKLSTEQINAFLKAYNLQTNFGIRAGEVEKDLAEIAKKYI